MTKYADLRADVTVGPIAPGAKIPFSHLDRNSFSRHELTTKLLE
jgi:hypothetical protein